MKIYIDKNLAPRYSQSGWPDKPSLYFTHYAVNGQTAETGQRAAEIYKEALENAKADSVPFEIHTIFYPTLNACTTPDTFIECEIGEVEICWQWRPYDTSRWEDTNEYYATTVRCGGNPCAQVRKVARLKPAESEMSNAANNLIEKQEQDKTRCECELFLEKYFGLSEGFPVDSLVPEAQYFQLVNLLSMFRDEQLDAANKRIEELEDALSDMVTAPVHRASLQDIKDLCTEFYFWWHNSKGTNTYQGFDEWSQTEKGAYRISHLKIK